ncbi:MAG: PAS domain S-box protein [Spirochaetes bacterium]|nr:PAS domain S-box protein [Spirochaetota bacterium]
MGTAKILIVEDEAVIGMHIRDSLVGLGYEVCGIAVTGDEAIGLAREHGPDLILMDIVLKGGRDGIATAKTIRSAMDVPVVYMTGNADIATVTRARDTNPYGYVLKPVEVIHLFSTVDTAIERHRLEKSLRESEERFRALVNNLQDFIFIMRPDGTVIFENPAAAAKLGHSLLGRNGFDFVHPGDMEIAAGAFGEVMDDTNPHIPTQFRVRRSEGSWIIVDALASNMLENSAICGILLVLRDVTASVEAQKALRDSERRLHALFHQSPVGIIRFDTGYTVTDCNDRMLEIIHTERERLVGLDLRTLRDERAVAYFRETLEGKSLTYEGPYRATTSNVLVWIRYTTNPLRDDAGSVIGGIAVMEDITERIQWERKLKLSEEKNRLLIEHAGEGIAVIQEWRFVFSNPQFQRMLGCGATELEARRFTEFFHPDERDMIEDRYRRRLQGEADPASYEVRFLSADGVVKWAELNTVLLQWEGNPAALLFARDITLRKRAEDERQRLESQIQQTQKLESLGVLAGGIAHDFNNLLMAILGNIDLAVMDLPPSSIARGNLLEAARASQRAADLCRQMLAYSGRGRFTSENLDLNDVVEEMGHMLEVSISKKAVLRFNFARGLPSIVADATQVRQIIMNLVINASDAIGERSGIISVSTGAMECDDDYLSETWLNERLEEGMYVYLEVADTGEGMDQETLPKIFDPFFTTKFTGRGLGLAAVLGIVRGHRGAIKVYSEKGRGTTFKVLLPAAEASPKGAGSAPERAPAWRGSGTVLLADDEETIRNLGKRMLERLGFTVVTVADGREAVEAFRKDPGSFTCVILDLTMPHMDGEEAFREMRRVRKNIRVVISSGYNELEISQRFAGKGIAGFIQKPYQLADLSDMLKEILDRSLGKGTKRESSE